MTSEVDSFEIAPMSEGLSDEAQPWKLPKEAWTKLEDGYVYRGVLKNRNGITHYATGGRGGEVSCQSRIVIGITGEAIAGGSPYGGTLAQKPVVPGRIVFKSGVEKIRFDIRGVPSGDFTGTPTIDFQTGVYSGIVFTTDPGARSIDYGYEANLPVMGIHNHVKADAIRELLVADTRNVNVYNASTNRLDYVEATAGVPATLFTGSDKDFWSFAEWPDKSFVKRTIFTNGLDGIKVFKAGKIHNYNAAGGETDFADPTLGTLQTCRAVTIYGDRLLCIRPKIAGKVYHASILFSQKWTTAGFGDKFTGVGSGLTDANFDDDIKDIGFIRQELIVIMTDSLWVLKITQQKATPFRWERLDDTGITSCDGKGSAVSYFGSVRYAGVQGIITTDGYKVGRADNKLPFFCRDEIDPELFEYSHTGIHYRDHQTWMTYGKKGTQAVTANQILVNNVEENTWATFRLKMSVFGYFRESFDTLLKDFTRPLKEYTQFLGSYTSQKGAKLMLAGDHKGFLHRSSQGFDDGYVEILGITQADPAVFTVNPNSFETGDFLRFGDILGMTEFNDLTLEITRISDISFSVKKDSTGFTAYTSGGSARKSIRFSATSANLNPYVSDKQKAHLHWVIFYIKTSSTADLKVEFFSDDRETPYVLAHKENAKVTIETSETSSKKRRFARISVDTTANFHKFRVSQEGAGLTAEIYGMVLGTTRGGALEDV